MKFLAFIIGLMMPLGIVLLLSSGSSGISSAALLPEKDTSAPAAIKAAAATELTSADRPTPRPMHINADGAEQAWRDWLLNHNIEASSMALGINGAVVRTGDHKRHADTPYPVASLSKAITAICLNDVLTETGYSWSTTIADVAPALAKINMSPHDGVTSLMLADFARHTTGLPKNIGGNETAGEGRNLYTQQHFAREGLTNPVRLGNTREHVYSNVNYAILGQIITAVTGSPYGETCAARVTAPAGASGAVVGGRMWATAGFGGWSVSASDYTRFVMHWLNPKRPWIMAPENFPLDRASGAGLGVFFTRREGGFTVHHSGLWRSKEETRQHGALFVISETGATFVANWHGQIDPKAYADLRNMVSVHLR